jgi:hypothetical protein
MTRTMIEWPFFNPWAEYSPWPIWTTITTTNNTNALQPTDDVAQLRAELEQLQNRFDAHLLAEAKRRSES